MQLTREMFQRRVQVLLAEEQKLYADLNALIGRRAEAEQVLKLFDAPEPQTNEQGATEPVAPSADS